MGSLNRQRPPGRDALAPVDIGKAPIVWHVCTPKSASTYLMHFIRGQMKQAGQNVRGFRALPLYGERPQVLCRFSIQQNLKRDAVLNIAAHQHVACTNDWQKVLSKNHLVIAQTRNIFDTIASLKDHTDKRQIGNPWVFRAELCWDSLTDTRKFDTIIANYLPWHIQFIQSWMLAAQDHDVIFVPYETAIASPGAIAKTIADRFDLTLRVDADLSVPIEKQNFNVGVPGRGLQVLSAEQQSLIEKTIEDLDVFDQNLHSFMMAPGPLA